MSYPSHPHTKLLTAMSNETMTKTQVEYYGVIIDHMSDYAVTENTRNEVTSFIHTSAVNLSSCKMTDEFAILMLCLLLT